MRKAVMAGLILAIVLVLVLGILVWLKPVPEKIPLSPEEVYSSCVEEVKPLSGFVKALSRSVEQCNAVKDVLFREYCRAWFKDEKACLSLGEDERPSCLAILNRDLKQCGANEFCYGVIGRVEDCEKLESSINRMVCTALVRRDWMAFEQGVGCGVEKENFETQAKCLESVRSVGEVETCAG